MGVRGRELQNGMLGEGKLWLIHKIKGKMLINLPGLHVEFKEA